MLRRQVLAAAGVLALLIAGLTTYRAHVSDERASIELPPLVKSAAVGKRKQLSRHAPPSAVVYVVPKIDEGLGPARQSVRIGTLAPALVATAAHTRVHVARGPPA